MMNNKLQEVFAGINFNERYDEENNIMNLKVSEYRDIINSDEFAKSLESGEFKLLEDKNDTKKKRIKYGNEYIEIRITQFHESKDQDIKIESGKVGTYGLKLIYHRKKSGDKEFRLFISFKDASGKLRRIRMRNEFTDANDSNEKKMVEYFKGIIKNQDVESIKKAI